MPIDVTSHSFLHVPVARQPSHPGRTPDAGTEPYREILPWTPRWTCLATFAVCLLVYWPSLRGEFIWDDLAHVTQPELRSLQGLWRIWFEVGATQQYYPLLHSAFWLEHRLWGDATLGYHLINVLFHATAACLFGACLRRLAVPGANVAALLFALHPVCVESVAWISEQKNTLSTVLYLGAALAWLRFDERRDRRHYVIATSLFVLALLTKTVVATLPAALLVVTWWRRGRIDLRRDVVPLVPWLLVGAAAGLFTAWVEQSLIGSRAAAYSMSGVERVLLAGRVPWFYLSKLVWPAELIFIYPRWTLDAGAAWQYVFPALTLGALSGFWLLRRRARGPLAAALFFGGTLVPVLGFLDVYPFVYSFVADHFQYVASLGIFALAGAALVRLGEYVSPVAVRGAVVLGLAILGALTWRQSALYRDPFTLYEATLARHPACWMAHNNLGVAHAQAGRTERAAEHFRASLAIHPENAEALGNLGTMYLRAGRPADAVAHLERALELQPDLDSLLRDLGKALMALGRSEAGIEAFRAAVRRTPRDSTVHYELGVALAGAGRLDEAVDCFATAVALRPGYAEAEFNRGLALARLRRFDEALPHLERSLRLKDDAPGPFLTYGGLLLEHGRYDQAIAPLRRALELQPAQPAVHQALAHALRQVGRFTEAEYHEREYRRLTGP